MMRLAVRGGMICSIALATTAVPAGTGSSAPDALTQEMLGRIHTLAPAARLEVTDPLTIQVMNSPQGGFVHLDRLAQFCGKNDAIACEQQKRKFASGIADMIAQADASVTRARLRVIVRSDQYVAGASAELGAGKGGPLVTAPLAAGVQLVLAADFPQATRLVNESDIRRLGLTRAQAIALGTSQVLASLRPLPDAEALRKAVIAITGNDYGASLLLASEEWRTIADKVKGVLWIAVPADERVIVGVARSEADLAKLKAVVAQDYATAPRGISPLIFRWTAGGWVPIA